MSNSLLPDAPSHLAATAQTLYGTFGLGLASALVCVRSARVG